MHSYQRGRALNAGWRLESLGSTETGRLVGVVMARLVRLLGIVSVVICNGAKRSWQNHMFGEGIRFPLLTKTLENGEYRVQENWEDIDGKRCFLFVKDVSIYS